MSFALLTLVGYVDLLLRARLRIPVTTPMAVVIIAGGLASLFLWVLPGPISKFARLGVVSTALLTAAVGYDDLTGGGRWEQAASYSWERATGEEWEQSIGCVGWDDYVARADSVAERYRGITAQYEDPSFDGSTAQQLLLETSGLLSELRDLRPPDAAQELHENWLETLEETEKQFRRYVDGHEFRVNRLNRLLERHGRLANQVNARCA